MGLLGALALSSSTTFAAVNKTTEESTGKELFNQNCASCHSTNGTGGIGLPLSKPSIIQSLTNDYIAFTIRSGRPGRLMPAFSKLNDNQVEAIVKYMRTWGKLKLITDKSAGATGSPKKGKKLYTDLCMSCHGEKLAGSVEGTGVTFSRERSLSIMPPALNNPAFQDAISDRALLHIIQEGREGTPMPSFKKVVSHQQTHDLISYIRSQRINVAPKEDSDESFTLFSDSPYSFDETVKLIRETIHANNYRVFPERYLEQGLTDEFSVNKKQIIIRFCNFNKLYAALKIEPRLGTILPCKVTVVEKEDGSTQIIYANVKALSKLFNNDQLEQAFQEIEESYNDILEEVTL